MFRRGRHRPTGRRGSGALIQANPLTIISSTTFGFWLRADLGITIGTGVSLWSDQSPAGNHFAQVTSGLQPVLALTEGPNGTPVVQFDSVDDLLTSSFVPGTTGFLSLIARVTALQSGKHIFNASSSGTARVTLRTATGGGTTLQMANTTVVNSTAFTVSQYYRISASYTGSVADELLVGSVSTTGASAGVVGGLGGCSFGASLIGTVPAPVQICEAFWTLARPSAGELTALDAYVTARYGAGLT